MTTTMYSAPADRSGDWLRLACRRTDADGYEFRPIERCALVRQEEIVYGQHDSYVLEHRSLHTLETSGELPLVTIVLQGHDVKEWSDVIAAGGEGLPRSTPNRALGRPEIREALELACTFLPS